MKVAQLRGNGLFTTSLRECWSITNLIPCPSFEKDNVWGGIVYDTTQHLYGSRSSRLPPGIVQVNTVAMPKPIINHKYYGRHSIKTDGNNIPADCRFEWFAGDGVGLNFVFGWNKDNHPDWYTESNIITVTAVNGTSYICRNFTVNGTTNTWCDGLMIIDLTEAFGAGFEPTKDWCDTNIPFFEGTYELTCPSHALGQAGLHAKLLVEDLETGTSISATKVQSSKFWECISMTNLMVNGSADNEGWNIGSAAIYDTSIKKYGTHSLKVTSTTTVPEVCITNKTYIDCDPSHIYYGRLETYQTEPVGGCNIYWPIAEPSFGGDTNGAINQWNTHSWRVPRTGMASGKQQLRIDFDNGWAAGSCWFDGMMIIDLTETFGAGYEPSKDWCDVNIPFFEGSRELKFEGVTIWQF